MQSAGARWVDALQYSKWNRERLQELDDGGLSCVHVTLATWEDARETLLALGRWNSLARENADLVAIVRSVAELREANDAGRVGIILGTQNSSPFEDSLDLVQAFHAAGMRIAQLTYNTQNSAAGGCWDDPDGGVTQHYGRNLIREMNQVGMLVDLSHSGGRSCLDAIAASEAPVAITHGNPAEFVGDSVQLAVRNRSNAVLREIADCGGVVGLSTYGRIAPNGAACTPADFADMAAWTVELLGIDHVGIGTDLYLGHDNSSVHWWRAGRWARQPAVPITDDARFPEWLDTPVKFGNFDAALADKGFKAAEREAILGGNWLRLFEQVFGG